MSFREGTTDTAVPGLLTLKRAYPRTLPASVRFRTDETGPRAHPFPG
jgi:hypothetical protein